jgi:hypothetical protein
VVESNSFCKKHNFTFPTNLVQIPIPLRSFRDLLQKKKKKRKNDDKCNTRDIITAACMKFKQTAQIGLIRPT